MTAINHAVIAARMYSPALGARDCCRPRALGRTEADDAGRLTRGLTTDVDTAASCEVFIYASVPDSRHGDAGTYYDTHAHVHIRVYE